MGAGASINSSIDFNDNDWIDIGYETSQHWHIYDSEFIFVENEYDININFNEIN